MDSRQVTLVLNRLRILHCRSLLLYLSYAHPVLARGEEAVATILRQMVESQQRIADRAGEMILELGGDVLPGEFPMVYTAYHDVSFDFLLPKLVAQQVRDISLIGRYCEMLEGHPWAKALAEEALGAAKAHLEALEEQRRPALTVTS